jgi:hypothetical protein
VVRALEQVGLMTPRVREGFGVMGVLGSPARFAAGR